MRFLFLRVAGIVCSACLDSVNAWKDDFKDDEMIDLLESIAVTSDVFRGISALMSGNLENHAVYSTCGSEGFLLEGDDGMLEAPAAGTTASLNTKTAADGVTSAQRGKVMVPTITGTGASNNSRTSSGTSGTNTPSQVNGASSLVIA